MAVFFDFSGFSPEEFHDGTSLQCAVPVAPRHKASERALHRLQIADFPADQSQPGFGERSHLLSRRPDASGEL
jgi:hypothetical protein